jgi:4-hydroxybenzoate polyprenyltransferase
MELLFWKNTASATGFLITVFGYPLSTSPLAAGVEAGTVFSAALFFFLFELSYEVLYDLRDVDGDRLAGVRSWPVVLGSAGGFLVAQGLMVASFLIVVASFAAGALPWNVAVMGAAPLLQLVVSRRMVRRGITSADCIALTWIGCALLVGFHLWEELGLPGSSRWP